MNLSHSALAVLPADIGKIRGLRILRLSYNKLTALPAELASLSCLEVRPSSDATRHQDEDADFF